MKRETGFTLIELMVVIGIIGILAVTAVPLYHTWQQRAYGSEAAIMIKQILDAQTVYFLDNDNFYPEDNQPIDIYHNTPISDSKITDISTALNISIPTGHFLEYYFGADNTIGPKQFSVTIRAAKNFPLFKGGFSPGEMGSAAAAGWVAVDFGFSQLRAETAAAVLCGIIVYEWGDPPLPLSFEERGAGGEVSPAKGK